MLLPPPCSTLFPYTTLFRSDVPRNADRALAIDAVDRLEHRGLLLRHHERERDRLAVLGAHPDRAEVLGARSEEHTSELQSLRHLVCRLLLEKKKKRQSKNKN